MPENCVFCDTSKFYKFSEALIHESENFYLLAATIGPITDSGQTVIFPKKHISCFGAMDDDHVAELELLAPCNCQITSCAYESPVTTFEHGIVGQTIPHAHLHFLPADIKATSAIEKSFPAAGKGTVSSFAGLAKSYRKNPKPYLFWISPDEPPQVFWNPPAPPQYWFRVAASALNRPERSDWRKLEKQLYDHCWQNTVKRLKPYFI